MRDLALVVGSETLARAIERESALDSEDEQTVVAANLERFRDEKRNGKVRLLSVKDRNHYRPSWHDLFPDDFHEAEARMERLRTIAETARDHALIRRELGKFAKAHGSKAGSKARASGRRKGYQARP